MKLVVTTCTCPTCSDHFSAVLPIHVDLPRDPADGTRRQKLCNVCEGQFVNRLFFVTLEGVKAHGRLPVGTMPLPEMRVEAPGTGEPGLPAANSFFDPTRLHPRVSSVPDEERDADYA